MPGRSRTTPTVRARLTRQAELEGLDALETRDLLTLLLGEAGGRDRLESWLTEGGGLESLPAHRPSGLREHGLGLRAAACLLAAVELGKRREQTVSSRGTGRPLDATGVAAWARPRLAALEHEEVWVLCVDARSVLRSAWRVGRGGLHGCSLLPRDVLVPVVRQAAAGFVLVHNHPSGDPSPSQEDLELTRALARAAALIGSPLVDHVIVAGHRHVSLAAAEPALVLGSPTRHT